MNRSLFRFACACTSTSSCLFSHAAVAAAKDAVGMMSFATDYPDVTKRELKAYYATKKTGEKSSGRR